MAKASEGKCLSLASAAANPASFATLSSGGDSPATPPSPPPGGFASTRLKPAAFKPPPSLSHHAQHLGGTPGLTVPRRVRQLCRFAIKAPGIGTDGTLIGLLPPAWRTASAPPTTDAARQNPRALRGSAHWQGSYPSRRQGRFGRPNSTLTAHTPLSPARPRQKSFAKHAKTFARPKRKHERRQHRLGNV